MDNNKINKINNPKNIEDSTDNGNNLDNNICGNIQIKNKKLLLINLLIKIWVMVKIKQILEKIQKTI